MGVRFARLLGALGFPQENTLGFQPPVLLQPTSVRGIVGTTMRILHAHCFMLLRMVTLAPLTIWEKSDERETNCHT